MDEVMKGLARELADLVAAIVTSDARVEACREKARAAGYEMHLSLEAVVGFAPRLEPAAEGDGPAKVRRRVASPTLEISTNDRRFLRSLRIAPDGAAEPVEGQPGGTAQG